MNAPKLAAAALAALLAPVSARPCEDHARPGPVVVVQPVPPPVAYDPAPPPPPPRSAWIPAHGQYRPVPAPAPVVRREAWREHQRAELRAEYARLDTDRAAFHSRWAFHPRKLARYDRWYAERRAELDRRWQELHLYAWR